MSDRARAPRLLRSVAILGLLVVSLGLATAQGPDTPRFGGSLRVAIIGEAPSLDLQWSTGQVTQEIMWNVFETLYAYDGRFSPAPLLAQGHTVSNGGTRYTIALRQGVRFHTGREMNATDVVASLQRWGRLATLGKLVWGGVVSVEARGPYTVVITLREPSASLLSALSRPVNGAVIHPVEVIEAAGSGSLRELIGTGPYRFAEYRPDRYVRLMRFDAYAARPEPPDRHAGRRTAYLDELLFIPVPDPATRLAGLESGEYHVASEIPPESYERVLRNPALAPSIVKPSLWSAVALNHRQGLMTSKPIRQAFRAALEMEPILSAGMGHQAFYRLDGALFFREQAQWYSPAGVAAYNRRDLETVRRLLREGGYKGQPVRWLTTREYEPFFRMAMVAKQQLEEAGFVVDLQIMDSATLIQRRAKPELFDVFSTMFGFTPDPALSSALQCAWPGGWCHEEKERLLAQLAREDNPLRRRALVEQIQMVFYEDVGRVKLGDAFLLDVARKEVRGLEPALDLSFWNVWLAAP
jgi:peptide/nickel transport system substrate-binding protein